MHAWFSCCVKLDARGRASARAWPAALCYALASGPRHCTIEIYNTEQFSIFILSTKELHSA